MQLLFLLGNTILASGIQCNQRPDVKKVRELCINNDVRSVLSASSNRTKCGTFRVGLNVVLFAKLWKKEWNLNVSFGIIYYSTISKAENNYDEVLKTDGRRMSLFSFQDMLIRISKLSREFVYNMILECYI